MGKGRAAPRPFEPQALTGLPCTHVTRTPPHTDLSSFTLIILARITRWNVYPLQAGAFLSPTRLHLQLREQPGTLQMADRQILVHEQMKGTQPTESRASGEGRGGQE